jgi:hypothetical protein
MFYNIHTGWGGLPRFENKDIAIIVTSLPFLDERGIIYNLESAKPMEARVLQMNLNIQILVKPEWYF